MAASPILARPAEEAAPPNAPAARKLSSCASTTTFVLELERAKPALGSSISSAVDADGRATFLVAIGPSTDPPFPADDQENSRDPHLKNSAKSPAGTERQIGQRKAACRCGNDQIGQAQFDADRLEFRVVDLSKILRKPSERPTRLGRC